MLTFKTTVKNIKSEYWNIQAIFSVINSYFSLYVYLNMLVFNPLKKKHTIL